MRNISVFEGSISLDDVLKELKVLIAHAEFVATKQDLTRLDKLKLKMAKLLTSPESSYFCPEAKLFIGSQHISIADVTRIISARGEEVSRSGIRARMWASAKKFVIDFGEDAARLLVVDKPVEQQVTKLYAIELQLLKIEAGIDYTNNAVDELLRANGINMQGVDGFSGQNVTTEQIERFVELIKPYTKEGRAKAEQELSELRNVLWYFRKALIDGSDDATVNYILRSIN